MTKLTAALIQESKKQRSVEQQDKTQEAASLARIRKRKQESGDVQLRLSVFSRL